MLGSTSLRPAVFLDRDGTISEEVGYLNHASRFRIFPFVASAIRKLSEAGLAVVVVTNQSGVGRGYFPETLVQTVHDMMTEQLASQDARVDAIYYCPHVKADNCDCRKPNIGMLKLAAQEHALDLQRSFVVGDRYSDLKLAHNAGAKSVLVRSGYGAGELEWHAAKWEIQPDHVAETLTEATEWILRQPR
jgi:D-glycero-D-manno-heptose 1,7-bisphosphate phosphatase